MQVFLSELVVNFSFDVPQDLPIRMRFANTLIPVMPNGEKGAMLCITRV
jgi:hypothetical protein